VSGLSTASRALLAGVIEDPSGCIYSSCRSECTTPAKNGDPCVVNADCISNECDGDGVHTGWCTIGGCSNNQQCGFDTAGQLVWCSLVTGGGHECFPGCSTNADCSAYYCADTGTSATCKAGTSINGNADYVCGC
jgi:hypothetical protein